MFIVFGTKTKNKDIALLYWEGSCERCNNVTNRVVFQAQDWFTLFWIPVFPISGKKYYKVCPICNNTFKMTPEEVQAIPIQEVGAQN